MRSMMLLAFTTFFLLNVSHSLAQDSSKVRTQYFPKSVEVVNDLPSKKNTWVFIMAGQSNMAGRGQVGPEDTIPDPRILTINAAGQIIQAKEPLNIYEPTMAGLDCGISFARTILKDCPADVTILLIHTAVGGSSIKKWIDDSVHREVSLLSNFNQKAALARKYGKVKGILWHQGEADANAKGIPVYENNLGILFTKFRRATKQKNLPIIMGELGSFSKNAAQQFKTINEIMVGYTKKDLFTAVISTADLNHKGDNLHFNAAGQREMGIRYANAFIQNFNKK